MEKKRIQLPLDCRKCPVIKKMTKEIQPMFFEIDELRAAMEKSIKYLDCNHPKKLVIQVLFSSLESDYSQLPKKWKTLHPSQRSKAVFPWHDDRKNND